MRHRRNHLDEGRDRYARPSGRRSGFKAVFRSEAKATRAIRLQRSSRPDVPPLYPYQRERCGWWHVSSTPRPGS